MLALGGGAVAILPAQGGAILSWQDGATALMRHGSADDVRATACFPLLPYCNRIAQGRFRWNGRDHRLDRNMGDHPHAIHGVGWQRAWRVTRAAGDGVSLALCHDPTGEAARAWPFAFDATLDYALDAHGLAVTLAMTNRHDAAAPAGIGLHPYFPRLPGATLQFRASGVWQNDATALPERHVVLPPAWDHARARPVGAARLDNAFTGWDGTARIETGAARLTIEADPVFATLQVFTPEGADFFCVEPVSHAPDAVNRDGLDLGQAPRQAMHVLAPGETLRGTVRVRRA